MVSASPGSGSVARNASTISRATVGDVRRSPRARTLASFHRRAPRAVSASVHRAARTPSTLLAAMDTPVPVQQHTTPRSAWPSATASPTRRPTSGQGSSSTSTTTSWPRSRSDSTIESVRGKCSSVPNAILTATRLRTLGNVARTVAVFRHTHWAGEWYQPFRVCRLRLVELLDELLPRLEADPSYARFLLDGQMAMVDDYLELRPHAEDRLRRLAASGRLSMGPWYVLMDEFCVSGETIVRDLQLGLERAAAFGGAMAVGYLPDMFGHVAQMPQILRQSGFEHAVVWRGVTDAVDRTGLWWTAHDGSTVRAELPR